MEKFPIPKNIPEFTKYSLEELEWNLKDAQTELAQLLSGGGAELTKVVEIEKNIQDIKKEIDFRSQNN